MYEVYKFLNSYRPLKFLCTFLGTQNIIKYETWVIVAWIKVNTFVLFKCLDEGFWAPVAGPPPTWCEGVITLSPSVMAPAIFSLQRDFANI